MEKQDKGNLMPENYFNDALIVMSNLIARASTKWSLEETKLFLCAVSKIKTRDEECWVQLPKKDLSDKLGIDATNRSKLREKFKKVASKSWIELDGPTEDEWADGFVITGAKSDKKNVYVKFEKTYLPLLDQLSSHFTEFYLDQVKGFRHLSTYNLYVYLNSWFDPNYAVQNKKIAKKELAKIFNLKPDDYWRNYGTDKARFHWSDFEKRCLDPAINEINNSISCGLYIDSYEKVKPGKYVLGYDIHYSFTDSEGFRK